MFALFVQFVQYFIEINSVLLAVILFLAKQLEIQSIQYALIEINSLSKATCNEYDNYVKI